MQSSTLRPLGTVNGFCPMTFSYNGQTFFYPGTTLHLTLAALEAGVSVGERVTTGLGEYEMAPGGGGDRTPGGVWMRRIYR